MRLCSPQMGISPASNLGGAVYDREILKGLAQLGWQVQIPLPAGEAHENIPGWKIIRTPHHRAYTYEYNLLFLPALLRLWRRAPFELLRIHSPTLGPLGWLFQQITGVKTAAHYHHLENRRIVHAINRAVFHRYDLLTTDSRFSRDQYVAAYHLKAADLEIVYPGVDEKYQPGPPDQGRQAALGLSGKITLLYLGVLSPRKNLAFLLDSLNLALTHEPSLHLVIAGSGPEETALKAYVNQLSISQAVTFTGYVPEEEKVGLYRLADLFVFPSLLEGFGMAVAEAMACGVPVVSSNAGSLPEVVGDAGLLASSTCSQEFADQILALAQDSSLRRRLGEAGQERIRRLFSWEQSASLTHDIYTRS